MEAYQGCGLALASLVESAGLSATPYEEEDEGIAVRPQPACVVDGRLIMDSDGDGVVERFDLAGLNAGPLELPFVQDGPGLDACAHAASAPELLGVADFDGDGHVEVLLRSAGGALLYGTPSHPARLERLAGTGETP